jgi:hypothetical protein
LLLNRKILFYPILPPLLINIGQWFFIDCFANTTYEKEANSLKKIWVLFFAAAMILIALCYPTLMWRIYFAKIRNALRLRR